MMNHHSEEVQQEQVHHQVQVQDEEHNIQKVPVIRYNKIINENEMTIEQRTIRDDIIRTRPRTGFTNGPFIPLLLIPSIAKPAHELGVACRYNTSLSMCESELIILLVGSKYNCPTEIIIHTKEAIHSGLSLELINSIPNSTNFTIDNIYNILLPIVQQTRTKEQYIRESCIIQFTCELLLTNTISDCMYQTTKSILGNVDSVLVEITSIIGYYTFVAYTLNVFHIKPSLLSTEATQSLSNTTTPEATADATTEVSAIASVLVSSAPLS